MAPASRKRSSETNPTRRSSQGRTPPQRLNNSQIPESKASNNHTDKGLTGNGPLRAAGNSPSVPSNTSKRRSPVQQVSSSNVGSRAQDRGSKGDRKSGQIGESSQPLVPPSQQKPQHEMISMNPAEAFSRRPREAKIKAILGHRKLLLQRIRACRIAASDRVAKNPPVSPKVDEVAAWKEMTRQANSAAKKSRQSDTDASGEKRTSVSLRRGASVGKRMNAALSSLAPGSHPPPATQPAPDTTTTTNKKVAASNTRPIAAPVLSATNQPLKSSTAAGSTAQLKHPFVPSVPKSTPASLKLPTLQSSSLNPPPTSKPEPSKKRSSSTAPQRQQKQQQSQHPSQSAAAAAAAATAAAAAIAARSGVIPPPSYPIVAATAAIPPHLIHHQQQLHQHQQIPHPVLPSIPKVHCPEAIELRKRRDRIKEKLTELFRKRQQNQSAKKEVPLNDTSTEIDASAFVTGPSQSPTLPSRRKTQWDYVMEEMRWMSTDFLEERKWKRSSSRVLSSSIRSAAAAKRAEETAVAAELENVKGEEAESKAISPTKASPVNGRRQRPQRTKADTQSPSKVEKHPVVHEYTRPSTEDVENAKGVAKRLSSFIFDAWEALEKDLEEGFSDEASKPHRNETEPTTNGERKEASDAVDESNGMKHDGGNSTESAKSVPYAEITKRVQSYVEQVKKHSRARSRKGKKVADGHQHLTPDQHKGVEFVDFCWSLEGQPGVILSGRASAGEVEVACSSIENAKRFGPHMVLCSTMRLQEWLYELKETKLLQVATIQGLNLPSRIPEGPNDVLLIDVSSFDPKLFDMADFGVVVVDVRSAFSDIHFGEEEVLLPNGSSLPSKEMKRKLSGHFFLEDWWLGLLKAMAGTKANRLIVADPSRTEGVSVFDNLVGFSNKERCNFLGGVMAFLFGSELFIHESKSILHRLLCWVSKQTSKKPFTIREKLDAMEEEMMRIVGGMTVSLTQTRSDHPILPLPEYRGCILNQVQRDAYERCCLDLRGSLSFQSNPFEDDSAATPASRASVALMQLRSILVHASIEDLSQAHAKITRYDSVGNDVSIDLAYQTLKGSTKLRELLLLLKVECNYSVDNWSAFESLFGNEGRKKKTRGKEQQPHYEKVAVLATNPKIRVLISVVLRATGIRHEVLSEPLVDEDGQSSFMAHQELLSEFNKDDGSVKLVVGSWSSLAGPVGGLGIDSADLIVSVDENWSGSETPLILKTLRRCLSHSRRRGDGADIVRFIRLVSADTFEERLICGTTRKRLIDIEDDSLALADKKLKRWSCDPSGQFVLKDGLDAQNGDDWLRRLEIVDSEACLGYTFPATNVLRLTGESVLELLATSIGGAQKDLVSGEMHVLLPFSELEDSGSTVGSSGVSVWEFLRHFLSSERTNELSEYKGVISCAVNSMRYALPGDSPTSRVTSTEPYCRPIRFMKRFTAELSSHNVIEAYNVAAKIVEEPEKAVVDGANPQTSVSNRSVFQVGKDVSTSLIYCGRLLNPSSKTVPAKQVVKRTMPNLFVTSFATMQVRPSDAFADSSQGIESKVYFPPLFPGVPLGEQPSIEDRRPLPTKRTLSSSFVGALPQKRPRQELVPAKALYSSVKPKQPLVTSDVMAMAIQPPVISEDEPSVSATSTARALEEEDEDFGLIGNGVAVAKDEAVLEARRQIASLPPFNRKLQISVFDPDVHTFLDAPNNYEDGDMGQLNSMLLIVKKKTVPPGLVYSGGRMFPSFAASQAVPLPASMPLQLPGNGMTQPQNGKKRKASALLPQVPSAFSQFPPTIDGKPGMSLHSIGRKNSFRGPAPGTFISGKPPTQHSSLFESSGFRLASARVRDRIGNRAFRVSSDGNHSRGTSSMPKLVMLVKKSSESAEPDTSLDRALDVPSTVNFGPFQIGVQDRSSIVEWSELTTKPGVTLPMGVKVPEVAIMTRQWSSDEDKLLHLYALKFCMNWLLVSRAMTRLEQKHSGSKGSSTFDRRKRSARQCKDRWHILAKNNPKLAAEAKRERQRAQTESSSSNTLLVRPSQRHAVLSLSRSKSQTETEPAGSHLMIVKPREVSDMPTGQGPATTNQPQKYSFVSFRRASSRRVHIPMNVPGLAPGQSPTIGPTHPSHQQALQAAVAGTGGREMWPLQILDLADKQRAAAAAAVLATRLSTVGQAQQQSSSRGATKSGTGTTK